MKTIMIKRCFLISAILGFVGCTQSELTDVDDTQPPVEHSRAVFSSSKEFLETYDKLAEMTLEEQDQWVKSQNFISVVKLEENGDSVGIDGPRAFKALFNEDLEFQIGDSVIWYNKGDLLVVSIDGNSQIDNSRNTYPVFAQSEYKTINEDLPQTRFDHGCDFRGNHILQYFEHDGWGYRYITELSGHTVRFRDYKKADLFLSLRLDYRGLPNGKWVANNFVKRDYSIDIEGYVYLTNGPHTVDLIGGRVSLNYKPIMPKLYIYGTCETRLKNVEAPLSYDRWYIEILKGSVSQQLEGAPSTRLYVPTNNGVIWQ